MAASLGTAFVEIRPDVSGFGREMDRGVTAQAGRTGETAGRRFSSTFGRAVRGLGAGVIGRQLLTFLGDSVRQAEEAQAVLRQTNAVIDSTGGVANVSAEGLAGYADQLARLAGVDDELVQSAGNVLLTFTNVRNELGEGNDVFDQALASALDLSAALGTDLQGATILVGKALNDPLRGLTALTRAGVQFTDEQKRAIETALFFGDTLGAQKIILEELETQFGGSAEANATASGEWQVAVEDLQESLGTTLLPTLTDLVDKASEVVTAFEGMDESTRNFTVQLGLLLAGVLLVGIAFGTTAAIVAAVVAAFVGLGAGIYFIVQNFEVLKGAADGAASFLSTKFGASFAGLTGTVGGFVARVQGGIDTVRQLGGLALTRIQESFFRITGTVGGFISRVQGGISTVRQLAGLDLGAVQSAFFNLASSIGTAVSRARDLLSTLRNIANTSIGGAISAIPGLAGGGRMMPGVTRVGETGPEYVFSSQQAYVASVQNTARLDRAMAAAGSGAVQPLDVDALGRAMRRALDGARLGFDARGAYLQIAEAGRPVGRGQAGLLGNGL